MRQEVHPVAEYKTESALWKHIVPSIKLLNEGAEKPVLVAEMCIRDRDGGRLPIVIAPNAPAPTTIRFLKKLYI